MTETQLDAFEQAKRLSGLLISSLANEAWATATAPTMKDWYLDFLSKILTLTRNEDFLYVSSTFHPESGGRAVVVTERGIITAGVTLAEGGAKVVASRIHRSTLQAIEVGDVAKMTITEGEGWPRVESVTLTFDGTAVALPVDAEGVSETTRRALDALVPSLIADLDGSQPPSDRR